MGPPNQREHSIRPAQRQVLAANSLGSVLRRAIYVIAATLVFILAAQDHAKSDEAPVQFASLAKSRQIGTVELATAAHGMLLEIGRRELFILDDVFEDETVETAVGGALHIVFLDSTDFRLGEDSSMVLETYIYDPDTRRGTLLARLSSGVFRIVSGDMHKAGFQIVTPTATIGIRGTDFSVSVATDGSTTVSVNEGKVEVSPTSAGKGVGGSVVAAKGQSVAVSAKTGRATLGKAKQLQDPALKNRPKKPALKNRPKKRRKNFGLEDDANGQHAVKHAGTTTDNDQGSSKGDGSSSGDGGDKGGKSGSNGGKGGGKSGKGGGKGGKGGGKSGKGD